MTVKKPFAQRQTVFYYQRVANAPAATQIQGATAEHTMDTKKATIIIVSVGLAGLPTLAASSDVSPT